MSYPNVQLFIDGKWRPAASGKTIPVLNPATEEPVGTVAHAEKADLDEALAAAEKGFKAWRVVSAYERSKVMRKAAELMRARADQIATVLTMEQGKTLAEAKQEAMAAADIIEWFAEEGRRAYGRLIPARSAALAVAVARRLRAAEGQMHLGSDRRGIHVKDAREHFLHCPERAVHIRGVDRSRKPIPHSVRDIDRVIHVSTLDQG